MTPHDFAKLAIDWTIEVAIVVVFAALIVSTAARYVFKAMRWTADAWVDAWTSDEDDVRPASLPPVRRVPVEDRRTLD